MPTDNAAGSAFAEIPGASFIESAVWMVKIEEEVADRDVGCRGGIEEREQ